MASPASKYWEIIADNLSKTGWSWGCVSAIDPNGQTFRIADAHRDDGKHFVVHADEKLTALMELESAIRERWQTEPAACDYRLSHIRPKSNRQDGPRMLTLAVLMR